LGVFPARHGWYAPDKLDGCVVAFFLCRVKAGTVAGMSSWMGWLLIFAGAYLVAVVARGIIQFIPWFAEEFFSGSKQGGPKQGKRPEGKSKSRSRLPQAHRATLPARGGYKRTMLVSAARIALLHWFAALVELARMLVSSRKYDYWVASALAEEDPQKKVKYLSKALALNPGYEPAWGLKGNALLALERYEEAIGCFEKVLQMAPNAMAWYEKGLCCHHLRRYDEAVECFDKTLIECPDKNSKLHEDALRNKRLAEGART
jgi:hypothetical protein